MVDATPPRKSRRPLPGFVNANLYEQFRARFPLDLARPFVETASGEGWSYADLEGETGRIAACLRALGLKKGDRVAVQVGEISPRALPLPRLPAGGPRLPPPQSRLPGAGTRLLSRRCGAGVDRGPAGIPVAARAARLPPPRGNGADPRCQRQGQPGGVRCLVRSLRGQHCLRTRRYGGAALHIRDYRTPQGGGAEPSQPRVQRRGAAARLGFRGERCSSARAAPLPHPRTLRRLPLACCKAERRCS